MNNFLDVINQNIAFIAIALAVIVVLEFILIIISFANVGSVKSKYNKMMKGNENKDLEAVMEEYLNKVQSIEVNTTDIAGRFSRIESSLSKSVQKVAVVRYKAFEDVGSDLSFSVALLDGENNGVILTGIYGRDYSTTYAKPIDKGISRYDLSEEELHVLNAAMNK